MVLLDGATLRVVAKNGAIRFEQAVTYLHPAIHAENGRFLVYDRGGKSLSLYSRTENLSAKTMEQEILTAAVAASGAVGVVTKSETGSSEVVVFDPRGEEIFAWRSAAEYGTTIAFSKNGKRLYAVFLGATAAGHYTRLVVFDLRTGALATDTRLDDVWISQLGVLSSDSFYAAGDAALFFFGEKGAEKERFDYPAGYTCAEFSMSANKRRTALLLEGFGGATRLLQFSAKGKQTADRTFAHGARGLFVENDGDVLALSDGTFVKAEKKRLRQSQDGGDFSAYIWDGRDALGFLNGTVRRFRPKFGGIEF
jgi:hypothetical protein